MRKAYFAAGCFWCITPVFYDIPGVRRVTAGYSGGTEQHPVYEQVKRQQTGHRETICVDYNDELTDYYTLLEAFLTNVDPFDDGGQFIDRGHSYTLAIYYTDEEERAVSCELLASLEKASGKPCAVSLESFDTFWTAEEYHQDYFRTHPKEFIREMEESGRIKREEKL